MRFSQTLLVLFCLGLALASNHACTQEPDALARARALVRSGQNDEALPLVEQVLKSDPKNSTAYVLRGAIRDNLRQFEIALADLSKAIELAPNAADSYDLRGIVHFKLGHIKESLFDFDKFIALRPKEGPGHWRRGIVLYYAGRFAEGRKQFEHYQDVDANDVENVVWRFLCMAKESDIGTARKAMFGVRNDRRVPMMQVLALFRGDAKPEDVIAAAEEGKPAQQELRGRLFFAHLYLGLYLEAAGDAKRSLEHITKAADDYAMGHYMWEVARVHKILRTKGMKDK